VTRTALLLTAAAIVGASGIAVAVALPRCETSVYNPFGGTCGTPIWVRLAVAGAGLFVAAVLAAFAVGERDGRSRG